MAHQFILLLLNPFRLRVNREGWWLEHSMLQLRVRFSAEGAKNVSSFWLSPLPGWGRLTITSTGKFECIAHHFFLLRLNPFGLRVESEEWWFEDSMSQLRVCLSAEGAKKVSQLWLSPLRGWGSLTMTFTSKFLHIYIYIYIYIYI